MSEVAMIHLARAIAITEDGQELPITNSFDSDGDECDLDEAVACVAGPDKGGYWLSIDLQQFEGVTVQ